MLRIVSIAPSGEVTSHWQLVDLPTARRMAAHLAGRLADLEVVKIRGAIEKVTRVEFDIDDVVPVEKKGASDC